MKSSLLKNILLVSRVILPAIICALLILILKQYMEYQFILIFGIAIILFNYGKTRYNFILSFLLSVILSYGVFFLAILIPGVIGFLAMGGGLDGKKPEMILGVNMNSFFYITTVAIIAPLFMFYCYRILFKTEKIKYFNLIKWVSVVVLLIFGVTNVYSVMEDSILIYWQVVMALALQLILYQKELKALFKSEKNG